MCTVYLALYLLFLVMHILLSLSDAMIFPILFLIFKLDIYTLEATGSIDALDYFMVNYNPKTSVSIVCTQ